MLQAANERDEMRKADETLLDAGASFVDAVVEAEEDLSSVPQDSQSAASAVAAAAALLAGGRSANPDAAADNALDLKKNGLVDEESTRRDTHVGSSSADVGLFWASSDSEGSKSIKKKFSHAEKDIHDLLDGDRPNEGMSETHDGIPIDQLMSAGRGAISRQSGKQSSIILSKNARARVEGAAKAPPLSISDVHHAKLYEVGAPPLPVAVSNDIVEEDISYQRVTHNRSTAAEPSESKASLPKRPRPRPRPAGTTQTGPPRHSEIALRSQFLAATKKRKETEAALRAASSSPAPPLKSVTSPLDD